MKKKSSRGRSLVACAVESLEVRRLLATYTAALEPLNNSGVIGTADITLEGNLLTVTINARGLEANQVHPQHIHGRFELGTPGSPGGSRDSVRPTPADDTDADGFIESAESVASAGEVILPLSSPPGNDAAADPRSTLIFPTADANGTITFTQQYDLTNATQFFNPANPTATRQGSDVQPLDLRVIEIHGLTVDATAGTGTSGEVNGTAGYKSDLPVAAGEIVLVDDGGGGGDAADGVFSPGSEATGQVTLPASFTSREAAFDNELGFFLTDADGSINGIAPGDEGWAEAGLRSPTRQILFESGSDAGAEAMPSFNADDNIVFYLIQDNSTDVFLDQNPSNEVGEGPLAFFSIGAANPDGEDHVQFSQTSDGLMEFRWEDLTGLGDEDFNDLVFTIDVDVATDEPGTPTDPPPTDPPPTDPPPTDPPPTDPPPTDPPPTDPPPTDPPPTDPPPTDPPPVPPPAPPPGPPPIPPPPPIP